VKRERDAFLYMNPKGDPDKFAQCGSCRFFMPGLKKCAPMGGERVLAGWSCGGYGFGTPTDDQPITRSWSPEEAGLVKRQVRCENCVSFDDGECELFRKLNEAFPKLFDLDVDVDAKGCCNAQAPFQSSADLQKLYLNTNGSLKRRRFDFNEIIQSGS
jgi:hypothetical protein